MKNLIFKNNNFYKLILLFISSLLFFACENEEFLEEVPMDFYAPENSYISYKDFEASLNNLHSVFREAFYTERSANLAPKNQVIGTDMIGYNPGTDNLQDVLAPTSEFVYDAYWKPAYRIIYDANVILERSEAENAELNPDQKLKIQAEARFFRGYLLKLLGNIYGGVPIVLESTTSPKRDYIRATRAETYQQAVEDLQFAAENLPPINEVNDVRINNLAAYHSLAEAYLSLEEWDKAIAAANMVIDDTNTALMTERFGSRVDDEYNPNFPWASGGDPYWDLFRQGNQNRSSGNSEALWVIQFAFEVAGGDSGGYKWEQSFMPRTFLVNITENDGSREYMIPHPNTYYGGRSAGGTKPSDYFFYTIWSRSGYDDDLRNSYYNIVRDLKVNNPDSDHHGKYIFADNVPVILESQNDTLRNLYPIVTKLSNMGDHPKVVWNNDQTVYGSLINTNLNTNTTFRDEYQIRLAETYLVRAEAFLGFGDLNSAAQDINIVRERSHAPAIGAGEVDIDYILDERARELAFEENRLATLLRLGKLVERTRRYGAIEYSDHQNLWPIPYSEIEKNTEADLVQNPGY